MAAIEDGDALSTGGLAATGIDVHQQLAFFAARGRGGHHKEGEGHPCQASAVATQRGRTAGATVQFSPLADWDGARNSLHADARKAPLLAADWEAEELLRPRDHGPSLESYEMYSLLAGNLDEEKL